jgi:hydrogenase maturation protease
MSRIVICGVGNRNCGDEGIGSESLKDIRNEISGKDIFFLDCGRSPQDMTKEVLDFRPDKVIIISALDMRKGSGMVEVIDAGDARDMLSRDGQVDVSMFVGYLINLLEKNVHFVGFQPLSRKRGTG